MGYPLATSIELTRVHVSLPAHAFFPEILPKDFECIQKTPMPADNKHAYAYTFERYERRD
jgi:dihydrofolate reductase